ncbi:MULTISPECIES: hypothetical protein [Rhodococcus]|uniref:Uncharacterized protein n=1 Tax=Rhodococcus baikonurensis TaxID=172041 RepID=A0ABV5XND9_9NOCA|nr:MULTISPECIES: hypothetical protein [Rhodococcus]MCQ4152147.1 hypothetical protein [Rhodococcus qingshengii]MDJ0441273.1 hypothetical protein [Rhodococcus qingshengii]
MTTHSDEPTLRRGELATAELEVAAPMVISSGPNGAHDRRTT